MPEMAVLDSVLLIKTDEYGNLEWEKFIQCRDLSRVEAGRETDDGGFVVLGTVFSSNKPEINLTLWKITPDGELEWEQVLAEQRHASKLEHRAGTGEVHAVEAAAFYVEQNPDGGFWVTGRRSFDPPDQLIMFETDRNGNICSEQAIVVGKLPAAKYVAAPAAEGGCLVALGDDSFFSSLFNPSVRLLRFDNSGNREWAREYRRYGDAVAVVQDQDRGWVILTSRVTFFPNPGSSLHLLKIDAAGELQWVKSFTQDDHQAPAFYYGDHIMQASDGGYLITGMYNDSIFLAKLMPE